MVVPNESESTIVETASGGIVDETGPCRSSYIPAYIIHPACKRHRLK